MTALPIVAVAAEGREFAGLLRHAGKVAPGGLPIQFARRAEIGGRQWLLAANGPGPGLAREAARAALGERAGGVVVSTGFCGALLEDMQPGDIVVASEVRGTKVFPAREPNCPRHAVRGAILSVDRVAITAREKAALGGDGACAVEMEAGAVAEEAACHQADFYCVRAVSDTVQEDLPLDFNRMRDAAGRFSVARIVWEAALHPSAFSGLLRLGRQSRKASDALGDYFADCEF